MIVPDEEGAMHEREAAFRPAGDLNLTSIGRHWARWQPDQVALRFDGASTTWRELHERTGALAAGLAERDIGHGDRVGILMGNRPEWIEVALAALRLGAVVVPLNVRFTAPEIAFVVGNAGCRLVVTEDALADGLAASRRADPGLQVVSAEALDALRSDGPAPEARTSADDPAFLCYTSGTTGDPKGAVLTHGAWNAASQGWAQAIQLGVEDRVYLPFPLAFTGGLAVLLFTYWAGARLVLDGSFDAGRTIELFEQERLTALLAVPVIIRQLVDHPRFDGADLSSWRIACSGGAAVPPSLIAAVQARGVPMLQGYSLTESSGATTILPGADATRKLGSAGLPMVHGEVVVVDGSGAACPPGVVGEISVRGPQVMVGYWGDPDATAAALPDGWLRTGDLGHLDEEGYLFVVDRAKDMLISGGLNVYPAEIERVLAPLPGMVEVAVIGVEDPRWGEAPAVIAVTTGATVDGPGVLGACRAVLADYKLPRYLVLRDEPLPRNMSGKVLKRALRDEYAGLPQRATPIR
jgi:fatty-acyl-CoA synthase